ncbi:SGNH/GDSL hydrolase family protein [Aurantiacibacter poecillastricola]|uniref:SGNH/GDSL hydrolase family protein n=1 Tax=Aurantiacibacter poecillastricola TaxID=3064385 RepID=UPI00273F9C70|nr:SGNH/GDSL hydrolase family protein [Aurantiacibacter sp. 219JJ12-13]MDP5263024.1 SGNH/GDSL hydrolase family protein [Aurantiacibacter sp. 219JJ12-13]
MAQEGEDVRWVETWGTALPLYPPPPSPFGNASPPPSEPAGDQANSPPPINPRVPYPGVLEDQTVRMIARASIAGDMVRLEFSNRQGAAPVTLGAVHVALAQADGSTVSGTDRSVTFGGRTGALLRAGTRLVSDPVSLSVPPLGHVAVSVYLPHRTATDTVDEIGLMPTLIGPGNQTESTQIVSPARTASYFWLRGISVARTDKQGGAIIALGDSITEGYATTPGAHQSWPEVLAERLQETPGMEGWSVINTGISGNRVLRSGAGESALARFTDDVLGRPGARWVIVLEGINDINMSIMSGMPESQATTADEIIAGLDQLVTRAHLDGLKIAGGTILPTKGLPFYSAEGEAMRDEVNRWIRSSGRFDAIIDFAAATRDPDDPQRLNPAFDPGDHVHPNDAGNRAMAEAIDLGIFGH